MANRFAIAGISATDKIRIVVRHRSKKTTPIERIDKNPRFPTQPRNPNELTVHHLIPRSRNGTDDSWNKKKIPHKIHEAWHRLFINRKPREIVTVLKALEEKMGPGGGKEFFVCVNRKANEAAWRLIFKNADFQRAIEIIKADWSPHPPDKPTKPTTPKKNTGVSAPEKNGGDQIPINTTDRALEQED